LTAGTTDKLNISGNTIHASGGGAGIRTQGSATSTFPTFIGNKVFATSGGDALVLQLSTSSKTAARVQSNILNTNNMGVGLLLQGGPMFQAVVQSNDFHNNRVGVAVIGNGATAGNVDLGGGTLGSTGGNNFKSFLSATPTSYAIGLFHVASSYSMDAKLNLFTPPPPTVIADGSHDTPAGGSGSIIT
jgi:nitrous oxidase accessory protein NosD